MKRVKQLINALILRHITLRVKPQIINVEKPYTHERNVYKLFLAILGISSTGFSGLAIYYLGAPEDYKGEVVPDEYSDLPIMKQYLKRTIKEIGFYSKFLFLNPHLDQKYLPDRLNFPYIQPKYTLALELTDVLVHAEWSYSTGWRFKKRPLLDYFLETLSSSFEIVVFTLEPGGTAYPLLDILDPKKFIAHRLVRDASEVHNGRLVKYLESLNRDMSKIVYIDCNENNVVENENLFRVKRWNGNDDDTSLLDLASFLKTIADNDIEDVRLVLKSYSKFEDPIEAFRRKQQQLIDELEAQAAAQKGQGKKEWPKKIFYVK